MTVLEIAFSGSLILLLDQLWNAFMRPGPAPRQDCSHQPLPA